MRNVYKYFNWEALWNSKNINTIKFKETIHYEYFFVTYRNAANDIVRKS